jgi:hypothetical protein
MALKTLLLILTCLTFGLFSQSTHASQCSEVFGDRRSNSRTFQNLNELGYDRKIVEQIQARYPSVIQLILANLRDPDHFHRNLPVQSYDSANPKISDRSQPRATFDEQGWGTLSLETYLPVRIPQYAPVKVYRALSVKDFSEVTMDTRRASMGKGGLIYFAQQIADAKLHGIEGRANPYAVVIEAQIPNLLLYRDGFPVLRHAEVPDLSPFILRIGVIDKAEIRRNLDFELQLKWMSLREFQQLAGQLQ